MVRSPNRIYPNRRSRDLKEYELGTNQIEKLYRKAIEVLLKKEYYEGTKYGKYYNSFRDDGRSTIYVDLEELEQRIRSQFIDPDESLTKILVGYMGVGKTTLIRNLFHVFGRDIVEYDNSLIIYVSYFANHKSPGSKDLSDEKKIAKKLLLSGIDMAVTFLSGDSDSNEKLYSYDRKYSYDDAFYKDFARFIEDNCASMSHYLEDTPEVNDELNNGDNYKNYLNAMYKLDPIDYQLSLLKYSLKKSNKNYENIYLILDDLETLKADTIIELVSLMMHTQKCMQGQQFGRFNFKQLICMRNHTYRSIQLDRIADALRFNNESISENIIYKNQIPFLSEIINVRYNSLKNDKTICDSMILKEVNDDLEYLLTKLYGQYDAMILNLTHYNLYNSLRLLLRILTNRKFLGKGETYVHGAFNFNRDIYRLENPSNRSDYPKNEDVFFGLVYGENQIYCDSNNYYLTNILHYHADEKKDTELLGVYIIKYMIHNNYMVNVLNAPIDYYMKEKDNREYDITNKTTPTCLLDYDSIQTISGKSLLNKLSSFYGRASIDEYERVVDGYNAMISHLYEGGALLQSISIPIKEDSPAIKRVYSEKIELYLSLRGQQLYRMLRTNSLLLQVYRDDIDTDLQDNNIPTLELYKWKRIEYCIHYVEHLLSREKYLFSLITNPVLFFEQMDYELAITHLMQGIRQSVVTYFEKDNLRRDYIISAFNKLASEINIFIDEINHSLMKRTENKLEQIVLIPQA